MTDRSFPSARQLLRWAREDIQNLKAAAQAFLGDQPYVPIIEPDPESGDVFLKFRMAAVPDEICKLASHALWDVKHALDHATCSAVRVFCGGEVGDIHFPIGSHPNDLDSKLGSIPKGSTAPKYPAGLHGLFRSFEPYPTGNGYSGGSDEFVTLSKLANTTKHAVPLDAVPRSDIAALKDIGGLYKIFMRSREQVGLWDGTKKELTIGLIRRDSEFEMHLQVASYISFGDIPSLEGHPADVVLTAYADFVEDIVTKLEAAVFT